MTDRNILPIPGAEAAERIVLGAGLVLDYRPRAQASFARLLEIRPSGIEVQLASLSLEQAAALCPAVDAAAVTTSDPSARAGAGERVEVPGGLDPALWAAVNAWDAERCRLNELWYGGRCAPCSEANKVNVEPMLLPAIMAYNTASASRSPATGGVAGIYIASKAVHGPKWRGWRDAGHLIISTWIDEAEQGKTDDWVDLWGRCVAEASRAAVTIVYREDGEELKGARVEVGAALAHGRQVLVVGDVRDSWTSHPNVTRVENMNVATAYARLLIQDATFDAPTHRVEAGAVAGDLGGVEAALAVYAAANVNWVGDPHRYIGKLNAAHEGVLDAVRALVTPAEDAAKLVDDLLTAKGDLQYARSHGGPMPGDTAAFDAARSRIFAHLAAKDRELDVVKAAIDRLTSEIVPPSARERFAQYALTVAVHDWPPVVGAQDVQRRATEIEHQILQDFAYEARPYLDRAVKAEAELDALRRSGAAGDGVRADSVRVTVDVNPDQSCCRFDIPKGMSFVRAQRRIIAARDAVTREIEDRTLYPAARLSAEDRATPSAVPATAAARGPEGVRVPAEESANPHNETWADRELNHLEQRAMGALTAHVFDRLDARQHDALCHARVRLDALERRLADGELAARATPDTARPSRVEGDGGQHG